MILRNCEWADEPDEEPQKAPRKRLVTEAMREASRANGAKSKGPKNDTTRAKVKFNAVKHGAACKEYIFLPGEDEPAFWAKVARIVAEEGAETELEIEAIKVAAYSRVTKTRAINAQAIAVTETMAQIEDHFDDAKQVELRDLIPKIADAPDVTVMKLMNSTCGCSFLIREFTSIEERLIGHHNFEVSQREYCLQLAGHRPDELFTDPVVRELNRSYLGSLEGPGFFTIEMAANALMYDRPAAITETEFTRRMAPFVNDLASIKQGWAECKKFVRDRIERLEERKELVGYREERALAAALGAAQAPCDRDSEKRDRYVNASDRTFNAAIRTLLTLKKERRNHGDECQEDRNDATDPGAAAEWDQPGRQAAEVASAGGEIDPQAAVIPAVNNEVQNEPQATQVVSPAGGNNTGPAAPVLPNGPSVELSAADHEAIRAQYRQSLTKLRMHLDACAENGPSGPAEDS